MSTNPHQSFLLADHVKSSLSERQRAISLNLEPHKQDGHVERSSETMREGIASSENTRMEQDEAGEDSTALSDQIVRLRAQYSDLSAQFHGPSADVSSPTLTRPNDPSLSSDFAAASKPFSNKNSSIRNSGRTVSNPSKSVRFRDNPSPAPSDDANRASSFPYRDDPDEAPPDHTHLDNQQIHTYHKQVIRDQDEQLDRSGESIGRQRELSIQMGDELDEQAELSDDVDEGVDRHQNQSDRARKNSGTFSRKARENWSWTSIAISIIISVLLIVILK